VTAKAKKKRGPGRPPHIPTPERIEAARAMVAHGMTRENAAKALGIHRDTFNNKYVPMLEGADQEALARVSATLYSIATDRDHPKCVTAAIWIEKTRGGYRDTQEVHHSVNVEDIYRDETRRLLQPEEVGRN
jgi:DNA-binding XRE family transcriptional regulator